MALRDTVRVVGVVGVGVTSYHVGDVAGVSADIGGGVSVRVVVVGCVGCCVGNVVMSMHVDVVGVDVGDDVDGAGDVRVVVVVDVFGIGGGGFGVVTAIVVGVVGGVTNTGGVCHMYVWF